MSSFPEHVNNIETLKSMGYDVEDFLDTNGEVGLEGWSYDDLTYLVADLIKHLPTLIKDENYES